MIWYRLDSLLNFRDIGHILKCSKIYIYLNILKTITPAVISKLKYLFNSLFELRIHIFMISAIPN